jgi:tetratricopeptide (TPR) repeat protein/O-antigen ligase
LKTTLGILCDRIVETGLLLIVAVIPIFFNPYSSRLFEPDKSALFCALGLLILLAWIIKAMEGNRGGNLTGRASTLSGLLEIPLLIPVLLVFFSCLVSTIFSVLPLISLWGSYERAQGMYVMFIYMAVFFILIDSVQRKEQIDDLVNIIILAGSLVAFYGILQHSGVDPLQWMSDMTIRVGAQMGNAIFAGAYLIFVIPVTFARMLESLGAFLQKQPAGQGNTALEPAFYFIALVLQLLCLLFTQSRGPWLGLLGGLGFFVFLWLVWNWRRQVKGFRTLWFVYLFLALAGVAMLVVVNLPDSPLKFVKNVPYLNRLATLTQTETGTTGSVRVLVWKGATRLIAADPLRAVIGYGPETMKFTMVAHTPSELPAYHETRFSLADRSHNNTLDEMASTGLIGICAHMILLLAVFYYGFKWLGFIGTRKAGMLFSALALAGAILGVFLPRVLSGTFVFSGASVIIGFIAGMFVYAAGICIYAWTHKEYVLDLQEGLVPYGLLCAIVAYLIEIQVGIAITVTKLYFWVYIALLVVCGLKMTGAGNAAPGSSVAGKSAMAVPLSATPPSAAAPGRVSPARKAAPKEKSKTQRKQTQKPAPSAVSPLMLCALGPSLLAASLLFTQGFEFISNPMPDEHVIGSIWRLLTTRGMGGQAVSSISVPLILFVVWLAGAFFVREKWRQAAHAGQTQPEGLTVFGLYGAVSAGSLVLGVFVLVLALQSGLIVSGTFTYYVFVIVMLLLCTAVPAVLSRSGEAGFWRKERGWAYLAMAAVGVGIVYTVNISPVRADSYYKTGKGYESVKQWDHAIRMYKKAIEIAPRQDYYYPEIVRAVYGKINETGPWNEKDSLFGEAVGWTQTAIRMNPKNMDHVQNMGTLYWKWAEIYPPGQARTDRFDKSHDYFARAMKGSPARAVIPTSWAKVYVAEGKLEPALAKLRESLTMDSRLTDTYVVMGDVYTMQGNLNEAVKSYQQAISITPDHAEAFSALGNVYLRQGRPSDAIRENLRAVEINPNLVKAHNLLGFIYLGQGRIEDALKANLKILQIQPHDLMTHRNTALLYKRLGKTDDAIRHMEIVAGLSAQSEKPAYRRIIDSWRGNK